MSFIKQLPKPAKLFIGSVLAIVLFIFGCEWKLEVDLQNAVAGAKSAGYVTELDDFKELLPKPSPGKDSAPVVAAAIEFYNRTSKVRIPYEPLNRFRPSAQDYAELKPFEPIFDEAASLIKRFQGLEAPDMKRDWTKASELLFYDNSAMHYLTSRACKKANLLALRGKLDEALKLLAEVMYCAELFGNEPTQMSLSTRLSMETKVLICLNEILFEKQISNEQLKLVMNIGAQLKPIKPIEFYMQSDVVFARLDYRNGYVIKTFSENSDRIQSNAYSIGLRTSFSKITLKTLLDIDAKGIQIAKTCTQDPRELLRQMGDHAHESNLMLKDPIKQVVDIHRPYFGLDAERYVKALAIRDIFDYLSYKTLKLDPFGFGKYILKKLKNGELCYSIGQFHTDRGGLEMDTFRGSYRTSNFPALVIPTVK